MLGRFKPKSEFSKNVLTLMAGTTIAQALPIAISPILTRIYTPEDFGVFAVYVAIISIFSTIVTAKYELAIMLPKNETNSFHIAIIAILINIFVSIILSILIAVFHKNFLELLGINQLDNWIYIIPLSVFLIGLINTLNYWLNSQKEYKQLSINKIVQSTTNASSTLVFGFSKFGYDGFIISQLLAQSLIVAILLKKIFQNKYIKFIQKTKLIALAKRYINFPKITMFHSLLSTFSSQFPIFMISYYFSSKDTGHYSFATKIIAIPIGLISSSFYQVFFQAFSKEKNKIKLYRSKFFKINIIFLPLFVIFWFFLPLIFEFVFGKDWLIAGVYAQILLPLIYLKFISNLFTSTVYIYYEKQFENLLLAILITILNVCSLTIGGISQNIELGLFLVMISNSSVILFKLYRSYHFVKENSIC